MSGYEERDRAYGRAVSEPRFECLYKSLDAALAVLRIARASGELETASDEEGRALDGFYDRLCLVEGRASGSPSEVDVGGMKEPFVVVVEGLDGSGKTTFAKSLAAALSSPDGSVRAFAVSTPPKSMSGVRDVFDKRGGAVARAFYMVSNYVLLLDVREEMERISAAEPSPSEKETSFVFVVDRWYTSTCAYTIGYKNTTGGEESIDSLDASLFRWPNDLRKPDVVALLQVDDEVRKRRVEKRAAAAVDDDNHNPWDGRLSRDPCLGKRIFRALERASAPFDALRIDANKSPGDVLGSALAAIEPRVRRHADPIAHYGRRPLDFFVWSCSRLGLCDAETGRRGRHEPWAMQLALNNSNGGADPTAGRGAPSLRTVGIHTANEAGILFFSRGDNPGGAAGGESDGYGLASMCWVGGHYPREEQFRAEGLIRPISGSECALLDKLPPASLVGQILACRAQEATSTERGASDEERASVTTDHRGLARQYRPRDDSTIREAMGGGIGPIASEVRATLFVPLRMEVLIGGPSSPGGPRRYEWKRTVDSPTGWTEARPILPFSQPSSAEGPRLPSAGLRPITVALTGTHCSGKSTLARKLASALNWSLHEELGDVLRRDITPHGHQEGYETGCIDESDWDDFLHREEVRRDQETPLSCSRIVETW